MSRRMEVSALRTAGHTVSAAPGRSFVQVMRSALETNCKFASDSAISCPLFTVAGRIGHCRMTFNAGLGPFIRKLTFCMR